jgi:hypothetical protein
MPAVGAALEPAGDPLSPACRDRRREFAPLEHGRGQNGDPDHERDDARPGA